MLTNGAAVGFAGESTVAATVSVVGVEEELLLQAIENRMIIHRNDPYIPITYPFFILVKFEGLRKAAVK